MNDSPFPGFREVPHDEFYRVYRSEGPHPDARIDKIITCWGIEFSRAGSDFPDRDALLWEGYGVTFTGDWGKHVPSDVLQYLFWYAHQPPTTGVING